MPEPNHLDISHLDVAHHDNPHHDLGHQDFGHFDFGHDDSPHLDSPHLDSHQDFGHFDFGHIDLFHTDLPHNDLLHIDDVGHTDSLHTDFGHIDLPHTDDHLDIVHTDAGHDDIHLDDGHADADHSDIHSDLLHMDALHLDLHLDMTHSDAPFMDAFSDTGFGDGGGGGGGDGGGDGGGGDGGGGDGGGGDGGGGDGGGGDGGGGDGGGDGGGCFTAETRVATPDGGSRPIAEIAVGDYVLARGEGTESLTARRVGRVFRRRVDQTLQLRLTGGDAIETTREHRFFVLGQGFVAAGRLRAGDQLAAYPGADPIMLEAVEPRPGPTVVYNLSVEHDPTYLVGSRGLLVHVIKEATNQTAGSPVSGSRTRPRAFTHGTSRPDAAPPPRPGAETAILGQIQAFLQLFGQQMAQQIEVKDRAADQRLVQVLGEVSRFAAEMQNALTGLERRVQRLEGRSGNPSGAGRGVP